MTNVDNFFSNMKQCNSKQQQQQRFPELRLGGLGSTFTSQAVVLIPSLKVPIDKNDPFAPLIPRVFFGQFSSYVRTL